MVSVRLAASDEDVQKAFELAKSCFSSPAEQKAQNWFGHPSAKPEDLILAVEASEVVGLIRLLPMQIRSGERLLTSSCFSSICIDSRWRGRGISHALMNKGLEVSRERGADVAHLVARRAVDGLYGRWGFIGIGSYEKVSVSFAAPSASNYSWQQIEVDDFVGSLPQARSWHAQDYGQFAGFVPRDEKYWRYVLEKSGAQEGVSLWVCRKDGVPTGYCVRSSSDIVEVAFEARFSNQREALSSLALQLQQPGLTLSIPWRHRLVASLASDDLRLEHRACRYGGLMLTSLYRTEDYAALALRLNLERLSSTNICSFNLSFLDQH